MRIAVILAFALFAPTLARADFIIDSFEDGAFSFKDLPGGGTTFQPQTDIEGTIAGRRLVTLNATGAAGSVSGGLSLSAGDDAASFGIDPNLAGLIQLTYSKVSSGGGYSLAGARQLFVDFLEASTGGTLRLKLEETNDDKYFAALPITGAGRYVFDLSNTGPVDLSRIGQTELTIDAVAAASPLRYSLSGITVAAVPEPSSLCLLGLAAAGGAAWRAGRRRTRGVREPSARG